MEPVIRHEDGTPVDLDANAPSPDAQQLIAEFAAGIAYCNEPGGEQAFKAAQDNLGGYVRRLEQYASALHGFERIQLQVLQKKADVLDTDAAEILGYANWFKLRGEQETLILNAVENLSPDEAKRIAGEKLLLIAALAVAQAELVLREDAG